jgi:hypothetical protein
MCRLWDWWELLGFGPLLQTPRKAGKIRNIIRISSLARYGVQSQGFNIIFDFGIFLVLPVGLFGMRSVGEKQ